MFRTYELSDPYNKDNNRTLRKTPKRAYNCGGYALNTYSWYCPYSEEDDENAELWGYDCGFETEIEAYEKTMYLVSFMVYDFGGKVRMIQREQDLRPWERLVLFRVSHDGDFHYIKKMNNGYFHKMGGSKYIDRMSKREVYSDLWCGRYDGPIVLLAVDD
jgi:hypothetical protein